MKFDIGTRVIIKKPKRVSEGPGWSPEMEYLDNKIGVVTQNDRLYYRLSVDGLGTYFAYDERWLTKINCCTL
jgi:hypothetical protein